MDIPKKVKKLLEEAELVWVGTSSNDVPNVNIVAFFKVIEDKILLIDNFFNKTRANIEENPNVAITAKEPDGGDAYQLKGTAEIHTDGKIYEEVREWAKSEDENLPAKAGILVDVKNIYNSSGGENAGEEIKVQ